MSATQDGVRSTLSLIEDMALPHPSGRLLSTFITEALNPSFAAAYARDKLSAGECDLLLSGWTHIVESISSNGDVPPPPNEMIRRDIIKRDGNRCCVTGKVGTIRDPLQVMPILPVPSGWATDKPGVFDMLGAFFGPQYRDWWLSYSREPEYMTPFHSHWLIRKSVAGALSRGLIRLDRLQPSMVEDAWQYAVNPVSVGTLESISVETPYALLADHSRSGIEKIDPRFVGTHARLCKGIRLLAIAREIASESSSQPPTSSHLTLDTKSHKTSWGLAFLRGFLARATLTVWLLFPRKARIAAYETLRKLGRLIYGEQGDYSTVQRVPFGLYLKYQGEPDGYRNEFNALQMVRRYTSIPSPDPLDMVVKGCDEDDPFSSSHAFLLITQVPGVPLSRCEDMLSDRACEGIALQLQHYISQLRDIPKEANASMAICNTLGGPLRDPRIRGEQPMGPFPDEAAFSQILRFSDEPSRRGHKIFFTHADLNPRNILVDRTIEADGSISWRVTGIVDWETSGYYPEYWDCTKALFEGFRWSKRYTDMMKSVFKELGDYSQEIDVEVRSWESGDGV